MQWCHDILFWKPIDKPNTNFVTAVYFSSKMQKMGVQNARNEFDFCFFALNRYPLKLNYKNVLCYAIFGYKAPQGPILESPDKKF